LLVNAGVLSPAALEAVLARQAETGLPLGRMLVESGYVRASSVALALADQHGGLLKTEYGFATGRPRPRPEGAAPQLQQAPPKQEPAVPGLRLSTPADEPVQAADEALTGLRVELEASEARQRAIELAIDEAMGKETAPRKKRSWWPR
jgi:hypothetical protein